MNNKASLYDTFNAKYLTFQEVSESFIPNEEYYQLLGNNHTLLMGPRGCGKTTLLKMLTPAGLSYWKDDKAQHIRSNIPFTAIYIPSDIQWKSQLAFLEKHLINETEFNERVANFLIATNIQVSVCRTIQSILRFSVLEEKQKLILEDEICRELIDAWGIGKPLSPSFDDIEISMQKRVTNINLLVNKIIFQKTKENLFSLLPDYAFFEFFDLLKLACKIFEKKLGIADTHRWALCFDELEISPKFLQIKLLKLLRSSDQKYLFKLTTTPLYNLDNNIIEASQDNDFKTIKLWVYDDSGSNKWRDFCHNLISKKLQRKFNNQNVTPKAVFGEYNLDEIIKEETNYKGQFEQGTGSGSSANVLFKTLAEKDPSFREFLTNRKLDPENPFSRNQDEDKSVFLKYKVNVLYRVLFGFRSRKSPAVHYGIPYIYDICDGNPRSIIGLVDEVLLKAEYEFTSKNVLVPFNKQSEIIFNVSKRYFNLIRNHPDSTLTIRKKEFNLATDILKIFGNYIYNHIVKEDFAKSIPTTFTVDNEIDQKIIRLLEQALFMGAIIYLDPVESLSNTGLIGKRFRLSYLLTPLFRIPNRVNSSINLKNVISDKQFENEQGTLDF
jgi:energy-coupling factor transporter ATP-binding protein EcfA2